MTLGFWTPLPAGAADEQPDDVRLYDYASVWGVRLLAVLALRFVMSEGADWMTPTRELMRAMWSGEPTRPWMPSAKCLTALRTRMPTSTSAALRRLHPRARP
mgnify:CR=1 FL=1